MKTILSIKKYLVAGVVTSLLVGAMWLVFPVGTVSAATPVPGITPIPGGQAGQTVNLTQRLENVYQREQKVLANQGKIINQLDTITTKAQTVITALKNRGLDTSTLEQALTSFQGQIVTGQTYYNNANSVLTTHSGFDTNGIVIDPVQAKTTLQSAHQDFVSFRQTLQSALKNMRQTIKDFRQANRPYKQNPATPSVPTVPASQS
jgi:hypothetical protein